MVEYCLESLEKCSESKIHKSEPEPKNDNIYTVLNTVCCIHQGKYLNQSHTMFTINKYAIADVYLYLCFQLRIMYVKK